MLTLILALLTAVLPVCEYEDSTNCYWNDGTGSAFVDVAGVAYYIER